MKKTFYALPLLAFFLILNTTVYAQSMTIVNTTNCSLQARGVGLSTTCNLVCNTGTQTVAPGGLPVTFPAFCIAAPPPPVNVIAIWDLASGSGVRVGNGCGAPGSGTFTDCQGIIRTVVFIPPTTAVVF